MSKRYGKIEETYDEIEWKLIDISSLINSGKGLYDSPSFCFGVKENSTDYSVEYIYGVKKLDGSVEYLEGGFFKEGYPASSGDCFFIKLSEFKERKAELAPSDVLTVMCKLKRGIPNSQKQSDKPKLTKLIELDTLSENFKVLFSNKESCDTTLLVKDREYRVHRAVLIARSPVFAAMFQHDTKEKDTNTITIPDCDPQSFGEFLDFLYCGKLEELSYCSALHLYVTSDKYDVQQLKAFCIEYLMENLTVDNLCDVVILADKYDDTKLFSAAQEFFNENLNEMFQTSEWECLLKCNYRLGNKLLKAVPTLKIVK